MDIKDSHRQKLRSIAIEAIESALSPNKLKLINKEDYHSDWSETLLVSILGFQGEQMSGSVVMGCDVDFLRRTCPSLEKDGNNLEAFAVDWIGELSNLIMGQIKNKLLPHGILIKLNPPSISEATDMIFETYSSRMPSEVLWFNTDNGDSLCFLIAYELSPGVDFNSSPNEHIEGLTPGSGIISLKNFSVDEGADQQRDKILTSTENSIASDAREYKIDSLHEFEIPDTSDFEEEYLSPICSLSSASQDTALEDSLESEYSPVKGNGLISVSSAQPSSPKAETRTELAKNCKPVVGSAEVSSIRVNQHQLVEVSFTHHVVFTLDPEKLLSSGMANFEMQGLNVQLDKIANGFSIEIGAFVVHLVKQVA